MKEIKDMNQAIGIATLFTKQLQKTAPQLKLIRPDDLLVDDGGLIADQINNSLPTEINFSIFLFEGLPELISAMLKASIVQTDLLKEFLILANLPDFLLKNEDVQNIMSEAKANLTGNFVISILLALGLEIGIRMLSTHYNYIHSIEEVAIELDTRCKNIDSYDVERIRSSEIDIKFLQDKYKIVNLMDLLKIETCIIKVMQLAAINVYTVMEDPDGNMRKKVKQCLYQLHRKNPLDILYALQSLFLIYPNLLQYFYKNFLLVFNTFFCFLMSNKYLIDRFNEEPELAQIQLYHYFSIYLNRLRISVRSGVEDDRETFIKFLQINSDIKIVPEVKFIALLGKENFMYQHNVSEEQFSIIKMLLNSQVNYSVQEHILFHSQRRNIFIDTYQKEPCKVENYLYFYKNHSAEDFQSVDHFQKLVDLLSNRPAIKKARECLYTKVEKSCLPFFTLNDHQKKSDLSLQGRPMHGH